MFGKRTIEQWWNSGVGRPPFDKVQGGTIQRGLAGLYGVDSNSSFIYFFGEDRELYRMKGGSYGSVTPTAIVEEFQSYADVSDVIVWTMKLRGMELICVVFPSANKSWIYAENGNWFEWTSGLKEDRTKANSYISIYNKHLVEDHENGNIYELDFDTYTDNGDTIIRYRDTGLIDGELFGAPDKEIFMSKFVVNMERGIGLLSGQGQDPEVMLSFSDDGGRTFGSEIRGHIGKLGEFQRKVEWNALGNFYSRIIRLKISDPVSFTIKNCYAEGEVGI